MKCRKCQSENLVMQPNAKNPNATEVVCGDCGAWQKFIGKDEIRLYRLKRSVQKSELDGCDYCLRAKSLNGENDVCTVKIFKRTLHSEYSDSFYDTEMKINYCPMCGKRLEV